MRADAESLAAKPVAGAPEAGDHLIRDQQDAVLVADALNFRPIGAGRNDHPARALHRLADKGRNLIDAQFQDHFFQLTRAQQAELVRRHVAAFGIPVRLADMDDPADHPAMGMDRGHAAQAAAAHGGAVVAILAGNDHRLFRLALDVPVPADQTDIRVIGLGPRSGKEDMVQIARGQFGKLGGKGNGRNMRCLEEGVVIAQLFHLARGHCGQFLAPVADVHTPQSSHAVDDPVTFAVGQPNALALRHHPHTLGRKFGPGCEGVHVMCRVQRLQFSGGQMVGDLVHGTLGMSGRCRGRCTQAGIGNRDGR